MDTRAHIHHAGDAYLCPLGKLQLSAAAVDDLITQALAAGSLGRISRPDADGQPVLDDCGQPVIHVRRQVSFFYRCAAVADVVVHETPEATWSIRLYANNPPQWLEPLLGTLLEQIQARRIEGDAPRLATLTVDAPEHAAVQAVATAPVTTIAPVMTSAPVTRIAPASQTGLAVVTAAHTLLALQAHEVPLYRPDALMYPIAPTRSYRELAAAALVQPDRLLLAISNTGRAYTLPPSLVTPMLANATGHALADHLGLAQGEQITLVTTVPAERPGLTAVVLSSNGQIKRLALEELIPATTRGRTIMGGGNMMMVPSHPLTSASSWLSICRM